MHTGLPENLEYIGDYAFSLCNEKAVFVCYAENPPSLGTDVFYSSYDNGVLYVPEQSLTAYRNDAKWNKFKCIEPISTTPDGMESLKFDSDDENNFNLNGTRLKTPAGSKGIFISGGKKYMNNSK